MSDTTGDRADGSAGQPSGLQQQIERGLEFAHIMLTVNQKQGSEAIASIQALVELLMRKGIIGQHELKEMIERMREEVAKALVPRVRLGDMGDKYAEGQKVDIDCPSLIPLCMGRCCSFRFFLTKQDMDEGAARWDYGNPYWIQQGPDGYCVHNEPATRGCTIYAKRPHVCRVFDCRKDKRIWIDFEKRIPAPPREYPGNPPVALAELTLRDPAKEGKEQKAEPIGGLPPE